MSTQMLLLRHGGTELPVCFAVIDAAPAPAEFLGEGELTRLEGFQFAAKRDEFLRGRLAAKCALGALLGEPDLRRIEIHPGHYGQPMVRHPRAHATEVTVSHSHGLAVALAFPAEAPIGIDLETLSAISAPVILGELEASPAELAWLATGGVDESTACGVLWTAREAMGKSLKTGVNSPLGIFALNDVQAAGEDGWTAAYLNFPRCRCLSQSAAGRILSLAMPGDAQLSGRLVLPR